MTTLLENEATAATSQSRLNGTWRLLQIYKEQVDRSKAVVTGFLTRRLRNVGRMAPDILEVAVATLANPALGLGLVAKKVADRVKAEMEGHSA